MIKFICISLIIFIFSVINTNISYVKAAPAIVKTTVPVTKPNPIKKVLPKKASLIIDCSSKWRQPTILYQDNANEIRHPASLTKIMTVYLLLEAVQKKQVNFNTKFKVSKFASQQMPSKLNLKEGETISVLNCIKALLVKSANDVAVVVAEGLSGSVQKFCKKMNKKAKLLGMKHTHYENPSGVPNINQVTCANDIAILGLSLMNKFSKYWHLFSLKNFTYKNKTHGTHCKILRWYNGADGAKTGYICASGFNLWVTATRSNKEGKSKRLCAIIFGERSGRERDFKAARLLDKYFGEYTFTNNKSNNIIKINTNSKPVLTNTNKKPNNNKQIPTLNNNKTNNIPNKIVTNNNKTDSQIKPKTILSKQNNNNFPTAINNIKQNNNKKIINNKQNTNNNKNCNNNEEVLYEIESFPMDDIIKSTGKSREYFDDLYKDDIPLQVESSTPIDFTNSNKNKGKPNKNIKKTNNKKFNKKINKSAIKINNSKNKISTLNNENYMKIKGT